MIAQIARLASLLAAAGAGAAAASGPATTFYVVRHAERSADPAMAADPPLTAVGMRRAEELRELLRDVPLAAVYSTRTLRTWQTATPAAAAAQLEIRAYPSLPPADFFARVRAEHAGGNVLIVGHSNTLQPIVRGLGGTLDRTIGEDEFDNLFVVTLSSGPARTEARKYRVLEPLGRVEFRGVEQAVNLSGLAPGPKAGQVVVGADESTRIQVVRGGPDRYDAIGTIELGDPADGEIDIEGIARHGDRPTYFVAGSHSLRRKSIDRPEDRDAAAAKVRRRFEDEDAYALQKSRDRLIRLEIDPDTGRAVAGSTREIPLRPTLDAHPVLKHFARLPSKENGVDIEGIASDGRRLFVGFRGPLLRFGFAPVLVFEPQAPERAELRYVELGGRGIREIARVSGGFLIIAGPVGDTPLPCQLYFWDGNDALPGRRGPGDPPRGLVQLLGTIPAGPGAKAEGLVVLAEDAARQSYDVLVVFDGVDGGAPTRFRATRPR